MCELLVGLPDMAVVGVDDGEGSSPFAWCNEVPFRRRSLVDLSHYRLMRGRLFDSF
jgi:hypothetical protein